MTLAVLVCVAVAVLVLVVGFWSRSTNEGDRAKPIGSFKPPSSPEIPTPTGTAAQVAKQDALVLRSAQPFMGWKWKTIAFLDVETTGLTLHDRVVTLAIILLDVPTVSEDQPKVQLTFSAIHRIYNPGRDCNPIASKIHGHSDWKLRHQSFFSEDAEEVREFLERADLVVCHNAEFDLRFMNREFSKASMPPVAAQSFCTMEGYRRKFSGSASLNNVIRQLGLKRENGSHGALEDAWLTMNVFFSLHDARAGLPFSTLSEEQRILQNLQEVPPKPEGDLPPRKRQSRAKVQRTSPPDDAQQQTVQL
jgi:DNA polymerase-3 subunit epsilon